MKYSIISFLIFHAGQALACPYCSGAENARDKYTYIILMIFIALTYIPYTILYKMIKKYSDKADNAHEPSSD